MTPKTHRSIRRQVKKALHEVCRHAAEDLEAEGMKVFDKMTGSEINAMMQQSTLPYRLAKGIMLALVENGRIDREWNAESLKGDVKRLRKIEKRYA